MHTLTHKELELRECLGLRECLEERHFPRARTGFLAYYLLVFSSKGVPRRRACHVYIV